MKDTNDNAYFIVKSEDGENYLCPLSVVNDRTAVSEDELRECVEKEVVGRYSGNIGIERQGGSQRCDSSISSSVMPRR